MKVTSLVLALGFLAVTACENATDLTAPSPELSITNTTTGMALGGTTAVFPSTNDDNYNAGWAHVLFVDVAVGSVTLNFVQPRAFFACFEYRIDDEAPTSTANGGNNWNNLITDGMWLYTCRNNNNLQKIFTASGHVDIRMGFGAERDERFSWTRFYVLSLENKDQCKAGQWEALGFKNQGQCVRFVETGKDSRTGG